MKILGQNGKYIVNTGNAEGISISHKENAFEVCIHTPRSLNMHHPTVLGTYSTESQAQKVLMDIFRSNSDRYVMPDDENAKPTNADRIRSMSDDDLAEFLTNVASNCEKITVCENVCDDCANDNEMCSALCCKWLKEESVEE